LTIDLSEVEDVDDH